MPNDRYTVLMFIIISMVGICIHSLICLPVVLFIVFQGVLDLPFFFAVRGSGYGGNIFYS